MEVGAWIEVLADEEVTVVEGDGGGGYDNIVGGRGRDWDFFDLEAGRCQFSTEW